VAALLAALAASSSPFVTTAAASEALKNKLADLSSFATGIELTGTRQFAFGNETPQQIERAEAARRAEAVRLRAQLGHVKQPVFTSETELQIGGRNGDVYAVLMARTDALAHVKVLSRVSGPGVWVPDITARAAGLRAGDVFRVDALERFSQPSNESPHLRVKGIYRALAHSPQTDYWGNFYQDIYPQCLDCSVPPQFVLTSTRTLAHLLAGRDVTWATIVEYPTDPHGITLGAARELERKIVALRTTLTHSALGQKLGCAERLSSGTCRVLSSLDAAVVLADRNASAVTPAVTLLSDLGTGIALAVAAAAGVFLVRRRRAEAALLYARGEHVGVFAARSLVEVLLPTIAGGAAGFALAYGLTDVFAPSGSIAGGTVWSGVAHAAVAVAIGIALLVCCAAASFLHLYDTGLRGRRRLRWLPWEAALLVSALVLYLRIRSGGAVTHGASHAPTLAVFVFPLLLAAAAAGIGARVARLGLRPGVGSARRAAVYLALRRLAAARGLVVVLAVVTAAALGAFFYVETLASSLHQTTLEKAYMATGSDAQVIVQDSQQVPRSFPFPITRVQFANQAASLADNTPVDVMVVDPATLASTLHWQSDWGSSPRRALDELARAPSQPLPVIVTPDLAGTKALEVGGETVPVRKLASVRTFPFMAQGIPLAITSYRALHDFEARTKAFGSLGVVGTYVWAKGPPASVGRALASLQPTYPPSTIETYLHAPDVVLATRTFTFMRMIAIGAGVLALLGLLLYLQARQRSQAIGSALARRMGFGGGGETTSLCLELVGILAFAAVLGGGVAIAAAGPVVRRIDPLPGDPPPPVFAVPVLEVVLAAVALVVVAILAGALTSWFARRTDVSEALRVA